MVVRCKSLLMVMVVAELQSVIWILLIRIGLVLTKYLWPEIKLGLFT